jgi:hypothetical protein
MRQKISLSLFCLVLTGLLAGSLIIGRAAPQPDGIVTDNGFYISPPVAPLTGARPIEAPFSSPLLSPEEHASGFALPVSNPSGDVRDAVRQAVTGANALPVPLLNFDGIGYASILPPDTDGQIGKDHYVQIVNAYGQGSQIRVFDKLTGAQTANFGMNSMWPLGSNCQKYGFGDPVVLYDQLAERWLITQFTSSASGTYNECIMVSKTSTPTANVNDWWFYGFNVHATKFNDYPKLAVWPDGYTMMVHQFSTSGWAGTGIFVFERDKMLNGQPASFQYKDLMSVNPNLDGFLPANLMGDALPPVGTPGYFVAVDANWSGSTDVMQVFGLHVDWATPANTTFGWVGELVVTDFDTDLCAAASEQCITQPGTTVKLQAITDRLMMHAWYRNQGGYESIVFNHTVDGDGAGHAGIRWYELRKTDPAVPTIYAAPQASRPYGPWSIYQQSTFAPAGTTHRWMGSIAMDHVGNIALGYSASSDTVYPSVRYTGRLASDPLNQMQAEVEIVTGGGSQAHASGRWGDYSALSVDPEDDCTFWYTQEYVQAGKTTWATRIASFKFPNCSIGNRGTLHGTVTKAVTGERLSGVMLSATASITISGNTLTRADGTYTLTLPTATYTVTASAYGFVPQTISGVMIISGTSTLRNFSLIPTVPVTVSGVITDSQTGWPLYARIQVAGYSGLPIWTDPLSGKYQIQLQSGNAYTLTVNAFVPGYIPQSRSLGVLASSRTVNFALNADLLTCTAPGYLMVNGLAASFDASAASAGLLPDFEFGVPPYGWSIVDNAQVGGAVWRSIVGASESANYTGGSGQAATASSMFNPGAFDTELRTPAIPTKALTSTTLTYHTNYQNLGGRDHLDLSIAVDGGAWQTIQAWNADFGAFRATPGFTVTLDLAPYLSGATQFQLRWRYFDMTPSATDWYAQIDDVSLGTPACMPPVGGLVIGNVYDANTAQPLNGSQVRGDSGASFTTLATPNDARVDDGFYVLYSPDSTHVISASRTGGYQAVSANVIVTASQNIRQNFSLPAGRLAASPLAITTSLAASGQITFTLHLTNTGSSALHFDLAAAPLQKATGLVMHLPDYGRARTPAARTHPQTMVMPRFSAAYDFILGDTYLADTVFDVLVLTPDVGSNNGGSVATLLAALAAFPDLNVSVWNPDLGNPTLDDLLAYDVILLGNDFLWNNLDKDVVGDRLADYIDRGGKVIEGLYVQSYDAWGFGGRYLRDGYSPYTPATGDEWQADQLRLLGPAAALLPGISTAQDSWAHQNPGLALNATLLGVWANSGQPAIAANANVVALNQLLHHHAKWDGNTGVVLHNAVLWLMDAPASAVPWLSFTPISGTLSAGASRPITLTLDASQVALPGVVHAILQVDEDTPYGRIEIPVTLTVFDEKLVFKIYLPTLLR